MNPVLEALIAFLLVFGAVFTLVGSYALARLPDLMTRLHGPTKASTLGVGAILIGSMLFFPAAGHGFTAHELLITLFLFLTAPISGMMIAKGWIWRRRGAAGREDAQLPPPPSGTTDWATFAGAGPVDETCRIDETGPKG